MAGQVEAIIADLDRLTEREMVALTLEVTANLREDTPVDTGWAAANWVPSVGSQAADPPQLPGRANPGDVVSALARAGEGEAELLGYRLSQGSTFVTNGVPYIQPLNNGSSAKAPAGFVQAGVERAVSRLGGR